MGSSRKSDGFLEPNLKNLIKNIKKLFSTLKELDMVINYQKKGINKVNSTIYGFKLEFS